MNNLIDLTPLFAALFELQKYFVTHILVWNMVAQLIVAGLIYILARMGAEVLRPRAHGFLQRHPWVEHSLPHLIKLFVARLISPIIAILLLWVVYRTAAHFHWPDHGIRMVLSLFLAWVASRLLMVQMKNRTLARIMSVIIWSIAALDIFHVLIPCLVLLHSIDLSFDGVRLSVSTMIQGVLILGLLFWLAKKASMLFEHWIRSDPAPDPRPVDRARFVG